MLLCLASGCTAQPDDSGKQEDAMKWDKKFSVDKTLNVSVGDSRTISIDKKIEKHNYIGIELETDANVRGTMVFANENNPDETLTEEFFIPAGTNGFFTQLIDFYSENDYVKIWKEITFENVGIYKNRTMVSDKEKTITVKNVYSAKRDWVDENVVYLKSNKLKLGIDMNAGGAITYLEYLGARVQQVKDTDGSVKVGVNYGSTIGGDLMSSEVNLINEMDRGRLVQQSYYGTSSAPYECAQYIGMPWPYNPVQGGDYLGTSSKIVDYKISDDEIYIKTMPLDWAKEESITPSYMENVYTIENGLIKVKNVFTDWSGYTNTVYRDQELPAFYGILPLGTLVTYRGDAPFTDAELSYYPNLGNWVGSSRAMWSDITENWVAWVNDDDFGVGLYTPDVSTILTGKVGSNDFTGQASRAAGTTYTAMVSKMKLTTYESFSYEYYLTVGNVDAIRQNFKTLSSTCSNPEIVTRREIG